MVLDDKIFLCSGGKFFGREDSAFSKNGQKKCPKSDSPKKSWKKNGKFASTCVGPLFGTFSEKSGFFLHYVVSWALRQASYGFEKGRK